MFKTYTKEAAFAVDAVSIASSLCQRIQRELLLESVSKKDQSPVTVADFVSQAVVAHMLAEEFPQVSLVAEEDSTLLKEDDQKKILDLVYQYVAETYPKVTKNLILEWIDRGNAVPEGNFWTLDPVDGTKGFLRGDQYVVALALIKNGQVEVGAMGCPNLDANMQPDLGGAGSVTIAVRDEGAWVRSMAGGEWNRLNVSACDVPDCARMLRSFESSHTDPRKIDHFAKELGMKNEPILMDSSGKYGLLAAGRGEFILRLLSPFRPEYSENIWDHAAGALLIEEAGGRITDLQGNALDFNRGKNLKDNIGILASNGHLHDRILEVLAQVGANQRPQNL